MDGSPEVHKVAPAQLEDFDAFDGVEGQASVFDRYLSPPSYLQHHPGLGVDSGVSA